MEKHIERAKGLAALVLLLALGISGRAFGENLGEGWEWRRPLAFRQAVSDAPGENLAWAEFYTNGAQATDGADIRVTTGDRVVVAHKIMQVSRDSDLVRVVFATHGDGPYYVWWGNPKAEKAGGKELEVQRGIYLEVSRNTANGRAGAAAAAAGGGGATGPVLASYFLPEMALGYNPFGDDRNAVLHYSGSFKIDRPIKPQFAFTVSDTAVLTIDGKEIDRQQRGGLRSQVRTPLAVDLAAGWHALDIRQVNQNQPNMVMALVWERPGEKAYTTLPGTLFAPVARANAGALEKMGGPGNGVATDIAVVPEAEGFIPPSYYVPRFTFEAEYPPAFRPVISWDFGDGQTATGLKQARHIFLTPGVYPVTLKLGMGGNTLTTTTRVAVKDRLYEKFPRPAEDPVKTVQSVLHEYRPGSLPAEQAFRGMLFFAANNLHEEHIAWGKAWLEGKEGTGGNVADGLVFDETFDLARLLTGRKQYKEAAEMYRLASMKPIGMETRANLMRHEVMTLCDYGVDVDGAVSEAQGWVKKVSVGNRPQVQCVQAALAYALIAKGDGKQARAAAEAAAVAAGTSGNARGEALSRQQIRQGVLTRNVENYIRAKDFDTALQTLNAWELEFPESIWEGFTRTMRVKLAVAEGRNLVAARMALAHAQSNPEGFYAAELLYRAAENFGLGGEQAQAKQAMEVLKNKYPESPYARPGEGAGN